jgi:hypothetical protein
MSPEEQKQNIDRLWQLQEAARKNVQDIADHMAQIATHKISIPQERWDQLFGSWEHANDLMQKIGAALTKAHGLPP